MTLTAEQKAEVEKVVHDELKEFVEVHNLTYVSAMIENSTEGIAKTLAKTNAFLNDITVPATTMMINAIFQNAIAIMNSKLTTYLTSIEIAA